MQQAWSELQQLPAPWNTPSLTAPAQESVVEYGELSSDELDDELPASIPISFQPDTERVSIDSIDVTEQLLDQIEAIDTDNASETEQLTPLAYDPFEETFGSEEVVLDQYLAFECELLATAPRVINRLDTAFAGQLRKLAHPEISVCLAASETEPMPTDSAVAKEKYDEIDTEVDIDDEKETHLTTESVASPEPGDLLVIEDEGRPQVQLVQGKQFRQLFSTLQSQSQIG